MDFIGALGNLRARNYSIPEVDKLQVFVSLHGLAIMSGTGASTFQRR